MAATARHEKEMIKKAEQNLARATDPLEKLKFQCLQRGVSGIKEFGRTFKIWDDNGDKRLSFDEFAKGVRDYGATLTQPEVKQLFQSFDKDGSGTIDFDEILIALRPAMSKSRIALVHLAFRKLDRTGDGFVTPEDLKGVFNVKNHPKFLNGEKTEEQILQDFLKTFDSPHGDGRITQEEFEQYYAGVSASIDSDVYFDLMMRQAWKI